MAAKARLHWFWRGMIASLFAGACLFGCIYYIGGLAIPSVWRLNPFRREPLPWLVVQIFWTTVFSLPSSVGAVLAYALMTRWYGNQAVGKELHCRQCGYILRGLSEPRCPGCGEAI